MLLKIALTVLVIGLVWVFMIRQTGPRLRRGEGRSLRLPKIEELTRCPDCGTYRVYGAGCRCRDGGPAA